MTVQLRPLEDRVRLHEKTVQKAALGPGAAFYSSPVKTTSQRRLHPKNVSYLQVHPLVLEEAKRIIAAGTYTKIQIIDDGTVLVT